MLNINVAVEAPEEVLEEMVVDPTGQYGLKLIQRDATYLGLANDPRISDFIFKVVKVTQEEGQQDKIL